MHIFLILMISVLSFSSYSCETIIVEGSPSELEMKIEEFLCELVDSSFNSLENTEIEVLNIKESPLLSQFSGEKISFLSYFRAAPIPYTTKYFIGYNPSKIKKNNLSDNEMIAVLAHELAHTVQWMKMKWDSIRLSYSGLMQLHFKKKKEFEHKADLMTIKNGNDAGVSFTEDLISYRETNLRNTHDQEEREYIKRLYNFGDELREIERELIKRDI